MRILLGTQNIASVLGEMQNAFNKLGHETTLFVHERPANIVKKTVYDYVISEQIFFLFREKWFANKRGIIHTFFRKFSSTIRKVLIQRQSRKLLSKLIEDHDVFIFIWHSILYNYRDLAEIKKAGKKIVFIFCGDDVRWYWSMKKEFEDLGMVPVEYGSEYDYSKKGLRQRLRRIKAAEKFADIIYSKREQAQLQTRPFFHWPMFVDTIQNVGVISVQNEKPLILHAPTNYSGKGSEYIIESLKRIKKNGIAFKMKLIQNLDHEKAIEEYAKADIIIDQLFVPGGGRLTSEALLLGKVVATNMSYGLYDQGNLAQLPEVCPVFHIDKFNLDKQLTHLISNVSLRQRLSDQSIPYALKYLGVNEFAKKIIQNISLQSNPEYFP